MRFLLQERGRPRVVRRHHTARSPSLPLSPSLTPCCSGAYPSTHIPTHSLTQLTIHCRYDGIIPLSLFAYTAIALAYQSTQPRAKAA